MEVLKTTSPTPSWSAPRARPLNARPSSRTNAANGRVALGDTYDDRLVEAVLLGQEHLDPLRRRGGDVLAHVVGPDRQLAVASVDQDRQLDGARAAELDQRV